MQGNLTNKTTLFLALISLIRHRSSSIFLVVSILILPLIIVSSSFADVEILLDNGKSIIADICREANGKLICDKMGGTFELDKEDILDYKEITIERSTYSGSRTETQEPEVSEEKKETAKETPDIKAAPIPAEGVLVKDLSPEAAKRLDEIEKRKRELATDREGLMKEREELREEIKNAGVMKRGEKFNALQKRIYDLDEKLNRFNEEVNKLNEEENEISKGSGKTK